MMVGSADLSCRKPLTMSYQPPGHGKDDLGRRNAGPEPVRVAKLDYERHDEAMRHVVPIP
jgi:hypothetical protein